MELSIEEEALIHALSDEEIAAVIVSLEAAEVAKLAHQDCGTAMWGVQTECVEKFGPYTVVQQLRARMRQRLSS